MITSDERMEEYRSLPAPLIPLYASPESGALWYSVYVNNISPEYKYHIFGNIIGDTILGFHTTSELPTLLQKEVGVSADAAMRIMGELEEFLTPVIAREKGEVNPNRAELQELQESLTPPPAGAVVPPTQIGNVVEEPTPSPSPPELHTPVQAMRTMEGDMSRIHGYGAYRAEFPEEPQVAEHTEKVIRSASQQDLLQEKPKLAGMPTYEEKD